MDRKGFTHALIYRIGAGAVFFFFLGFMVFVVIFTQGRRSGVTTMDAEKLREDVVPRESVVVLE